MKNLLTQHILKTLTLTLLTITAVHSHAVTDPSLAAKNIVALEKAGQISLALAETLALQNRIGTEIHLDETIQMVKTNTNEIRNEVVTQQGSQGLSYSLLFFFSGGASETWDVTQIITANPEDVNSEASRISANDAKLRANIRQYILQNKESLLQIKALGAKALQLSTKLSADDLQASLVEIDRSYAVAKAFNFGFSGVNEINHCTTVNHAAHSTNETANISLLFFDFSYQKTKQSLAYSEKNCASNSHTQTVNANEVLRYELAQIDLIIDASYKKLSLQYLNTVKAPVFPTYGSPYYK